MSFIRPKRLSIVLGIFVLRIQRHLMVSLERFIILDFSGKFEGFSSMTLYHLWKFFLRFSEDICMKRH